MACRTRPHFAAVPHRQVGPASHHDRVRGLTQAAFRGVTALQQPAEPWLQPVNPKRVVKIFTAKVGWSHGYDGLVALRGSFSMRVMPAFFLREYGLNAIRASKRIAIPAAVWAISGASGTVRQRMGVVALAVASQLSASLGRDFAKGEGAASPSAGDSRRYNGGSVQMHPATLRRSRAVGSRDHFFSAAMIAFA